jgi:hypothetical protein
LCKSAALSTPSKRQKESARSKSPFRSFRWKKAKSPAAAAAAMPGSASDDESNLERAAGKSVCPLSVRPAAVGRLQRVNDRRARKAFVLETT